MLLFVATHHAIFAAQNLLGWARFQPLTEPRAVSNRVGTPAAPSYAYYVVVSQPFPAVLFRRFICGVASLLHRRRHCRGGRGSNRGRR